MPSEIRFYHLQRSRLEEALPLLLQRTLAKGWRAVVKAGSAERVDHLNQQLWVQDEQSFVPHGSTKDGDPEMQPVWLTDGDDRPNNAQVLMLVDGASSDNLEDYALVCTIFDGNDEEAVALARTQWKLWQGKADKQTYWQQTGNSWEQKA